MAGMDQQLLAGRQVLFHDLAREVEPDRAGAADLLQGEALAAEEAGPEPALPGELQGHRLLRAKERLLAADQGFAGRQCLGDDGPGKARREGDVARALCGEVGDEQAAAGEAALQARQEAAAGVGIHDDRIVHPGHGVGLAVDLLAGIEVDRHRLHHRAGNLELHATPPSGERATETIEQGRAQSPHAIDDEAAEQHRGARPRELAVSVRDRRAQRQVRVDEVRPRQRAQVRAARGENRVHVVGALDRTHRHCHSRRQMTLMDEPW